MKLAISNIAWELADEPAMRERMQALGIRGVEVAPTRIDPNPLELPESRLADYRASWEAAGIRIVALQALLFGHPELVLFGDEASRLALVDYLDGMFRVAAELGAYALVFGSPKNRRRGDLSPEEARRIAVPLFRELGERAASRGVALVMEANPPQYNCDFITTSTEAAELVQEVDSPGFRLHLDVAGMWLAGEDPVEAVRAHGATLAHFHVSAPELGPVGSETRLPYDEALAALVASGYDGWVSIEMRAAPTGEQSLARAEQALERVGAVLSRIQGS